MVIGISTQILKNLDYILLLKHVMSILPFERAYNVLEKWPKLFGCLRFVSFSLEKPRGLCDFFSP